MKKTIITLTVSLAALLAVAAVVVASGAYNVAADEEHSALTHWVLRTARDRSIAARASALAVPELSNETRIRRGAGNYAAMCEGCHLRPGVEDSELSRGLYPRPPSLANETVNPAYAFWVIKHGIKASGMPAWGRSMSDEYIWDMVALLQKLPTMSNEQYAEAVRASAGHSHGGREGTSHEEAHEHVAVPDDQAEATEHSHSHASGSDAAHQDSSIAGSQNTEDGHAHSHTHH